jgi:pyruvate/2-oxoacid:ferredoxin oxidoreductase alpha subunit
VEQNVSAQLGGIIREKTGMKFHQAVLKYDGRPFFPYEIFLKVRAAEEAIDG